MQVLTEMEMEKTLRTQSPAPEAEPSSNPLPKTEASNEPKQHDARNKISLEGAFYLNGLLWDHPMRNTPLGELERVVQQWVGAKSLRQMDPTWKIAKLTFNELNYEIWQKWHNWYAWPSKSPSTDLAGWM